MKKRFFLLTVLLLILPLAGCASSSSTSSSSYSARTTEAPMAEYAYDDSYAVDEYGDFYEEYDVEYDMEAFEASPATGGGSLPLEQVSAENRKIVYTGDLSLQTTDFEGAVTQIPTLAESAGGFVEQSYVEGTNMNDRYYSRSASFTLRIPSEELDNFVELLSQEFHMVYHQKSSSEITGTYYDTKARLESLRIQEERLKEMREDASELEYMLELERELANVLYEIESLTSAMNRMDASVSLSTLYVHLQEVGEYGDTSPVVRPVTFGERIQETLGDSWTGFVRFWQNVVLFVITLLPFLPVIAVIVLAIWALYRHRRKKRGAAETPEAGSTIYPFVTPKKKEQVEDPAEDKDPDDH